jgi:peptidoglycan/xylan/chitin deacetylase (PgdA/CDA1 family)
MTQRTELTRTVRAVVLAVLIVILTTTLPGPTRRPSEATSTAESVPVLLYHSITPRGQRQTGDMMHVPAEAFDAEMAYLSEAGYTAVTTSDLLAYVEGQADLPKRPVLITMDDGYLDNYEAALPILRAHGMRATLFERTARANTDGHLTWDRMREMTACGVFEIQSHTHDCHYSKTPLERGYWDADLAQADREFIENGLPKPTAISYPMGRRNAEVLAAVEADGIQIGFTTECGRVKRGMPPLELPRVIISGAMNLDESQAAVSGGDK